MSRISRTTLELYRNTLRYFKELVTNTSGIIGTSPAAVIESLAIDMLDDVPWPHIDDVEWNFATWPFAGLSRNE